MSLGGRRDVYKTACFKNLTAQPPLLVSMLLSSRVLAKEANLSMRYHDAGGYVKYTNY